MSKVFVYEKHNEVLEAWAKHRKTVLDAPNLITFDHHTDVLEAFCNSSYDHDRNKENVTKKNKFLRLLNYNNDDSIKEAIMNLRNDEQIDAAIRGNIINQAFVISHDGSSDQPPPNEHTEIWKDETKKIELMMNLISLPTENLTYPKSSSGIYIVGCGDLDENMVLDSGFLNEKLDVINLMNGSSLIDSNFILDIDLDYFHTLDSTTNGNLEVFYKLINKSVLITIAKEPLFVSNYNSDENIINSDLLLEKVMDLINNASNFA